MGRSKICSFKSGARFAVAAGIFAVLMFACGGDDNPGNGDGGNSGGGNGGGSGSFTDLRDGKSYRTVTIGGKVWMAENLNFSAGGICYDNDPSYCNTYGRLYTWDAAIVACPAGWRLSGRDDWNDLVQAAGGDGAGTKLKSKTGWKDDYGNSGDGTDDFGFSAMPGGFLWGDEFVKVGNYGRWWSAGEYDGYPDRAWDRIMYWYYDGVHEDGNDKTNRFSVRCVKN